MYQVTAVEFADTCTVKCQFAMPQLYKAYPGSGVSAHRATEHFSLACMHGSGGGHPNRDDGGIK